jgi:hypothetical protein
MHVSNLSASIAALATARSPIVMLPNVAAAASSAAARVTRLATDFVFTVSPVWFVWNWPAVWVARDSDERNGHDQLVVP